MSKEKHEFKNRFLTGQLHYVEQFSFETWLAMLILQLQLSNDKYEKAYKHGHWPNRHIAYGHRLHHR